MDDVSHNRSYAIGVNADQFIVLNNLRVGNQIFTPDIAAVGQPQGVHTSLREAPLEQLRNGPFPPSFLSPRVAETMVPAITIRNGGRMHTGIFPYPSIPWTEGKMRVTQQVADMELDFEEIRRAEAPNAPSRLACIWLADDGAKTRKRLSKEIGAQYFLSARIAAAVRFSRHDMGWCNRFLKRKPDREFIRRYWAGEECTTQDQLWEYLLEGVAVIDEDEVLTQLRLLSLIDSPCPKGSDPAIYAEWRDLLRDKRGELELDCPLWFKLEGEEHASCQCPHLRAAGTAHARQKGIPWCMVHQKAHEPACRDEGFVDYEKRIKRARAGGRA